MQNLLSRQNQTLILDEERTSWLGGLAPHFHLGTRMRVGLGQHCSEPGGGVFQTVYRPGSPEAPAALLAVSGWLSFGCWLLRQDPRLPAGRPLWVLAPPPRGLELGGHRPSSARPRAPPAGSV